jgi:hypothetical protein
MPIMSNAALQAIGDKLALFAAMSVGDTEFDDAFTAGMAAANAAVMTGPNSIAEYIMDTDDMDLTADLLPAARDLDEAPPTPPERFIIGIAGVSAFLTALNRHIARYSSVSTLDAYLTLLNTTTPTLRFHQAFHDHLRALNRKNVFIAHDMVLAQFTASGAAAGTFINIAQIPSAYAGAQLVVKNQGAVTTGATLSVTGKKVDGTTQVITATIATGADNTETPLSVVTQLFVEVTAITISGATASNVYEIVAKTDRDITNA